MDASVTVYATGRGRQYGHSNRLLGDTFAARVLLAAFPQRADAFGGLTAPDG